MFSLRFSIKPIISLVLVGFFLLAAGSLPAQAETPDQIYYGGPIVTMVDKALMVEAVAVKRDKIMAVGRLKHIKPLADDKTQMIDLKGKTLLPGFIDPHGHFHKSGTFKLLRVDLYPPPIGTITKMDELVAKLKKNADTMKEGDVLSGIGYDDTLLAEMRHPTKDDLDKASTTIPIVISHISGHVAVGNSAALKNLGITKDTPRSRRRPYSKRQENGRTQRRHGR